MALAHHPIIPNADLVKSTPVLPQGSTGRAKRMASRCLLICAHQRQTEHRDEMPPLSSPFVFILKDEPPHDAFVKQVNDETPEG